MSSNSFETWKKAEMAKLTIPEISEVFGREDAAEELRRRDREIEISQRLLRVADILEQKNPLPLPNPPPVVETSSSGTIRLSYDAWEGMSVVLKRETKFVIDSNGTTFPVRLKRAFGLGTGGPDEGSYELRKPLTNQLLDHPPFKKKKKEGTL